MHAIRDSGISLKCIVMFILLRCLVATATSGSIQGVRNAPASCTLYIAFDSGRILPVAGNDPLLLESAFNDPTLRDTEFVIVHGGGLYASRAGDTVEAERLSGRCWGTGSFSIRRGNGFTLLVERKRASVRSNKGSIPASGGGAIA